MTNLLDEIKEDLEYKGKTEKDIIWVGCGDFEIPLDLFWKLAEKTNYDSGFGGQEIANDLIVAGKNFWLERHEYDGSEWFEFKSLPERPKQVRYDIKRLGCGGMWASLAEHQEEVDND